MQDFDNIIVGAGSAGCLLANRLSRGGARQVLLLESGGQDRNFWLRLPVGYFRSMVDPRFTWQFETEPQVQTANRHIVWPRGRVLGGSSSVNGLIYIRGLRSDFEHWQSELGHGWAYSDLLPYFKRSERFQGEPSEFHGTQGELCVSPLRNDHPLCEAWLQAGQQAGFSMSEDFNGAQDSGLGRYQVTLDGHWRSSAARAFLRPALKRRNLHLLTGVYVTRILLEKGRAVGVEYSQNGQLQQARLTAGAQSGVLLCAGAVQSPQLLQLSGIGDEVLLRKHGIPVQSHRSEVGRNLQDHYQARVIVKLKGNQSLNRDVRNPIQLARMGARWLFDQSGPLTVSAGQVGGMVATHEASDGQPDVLFNVMPLSVDKPGEALHEFSGFSASVAQCRPLSRGSIEINSHDPLKPPTIFTNYLSEYKDIRTLVAGLQTLRHIFAQSAFAPHWRSEYMPGDVLQTPEQLAQFARAKGGTVFHPCGSCRMGRDEEAVLDPKFKVQGIEHLRVIDASAMPSMPSPNINAATIMLAEKAASIIQGFSTPSPL